MNIVSKTERPIEDNEKRLITHRAIAEKP